MEEAARLCQPRILLKKGSDCLLLARRVGSGTQRLDHLLARVGDATRNRVACAVESSDGEYTAWAAGVVTDVDYDVKPDAIEQGLTWDWDGGGGVMPYRVRLERSGAHVYVHRDVHWLVRDLALQPEGPRQAEDGTRALARLVKRRRSATELELIDHETRKVRIQVVDEDDEMDSDVEEGGGGGGGVPSVASVS